MKPTKNRCPFRTEDEYERNPYCVHCTICVLPIRRWGGLHYAVRSGKSGRRPVRSGVRRDESANFGAHSALDCDQVTEPQLPMRNIGELSNTTHMPTQLSPSLMDNNTQGPRYLGQGTTQGFLRVPGHPAYLYGGVPASGKQVTIGICPVPLKWPASTCVLWTGLKLRGLSRTSMRTVGRTPHRTVGLRSLRADR